MKFLSFSLNNNDKFGIYHNKYITDLTGKINGAITLKDLIKQNGISAAKEYVSKYPGNIELSKIEYLPVIPNPGKIICVGLNYSEHVKETGRTRKENPVIFFRVPESQTSHNKTIQKPKVSEHLDFECEMAVIMGDANILNKNALKHIVGYSCYNESTIRDWQQHTDQFGMGKNFEKTGSFGPHIVLTKTSQIIKIFQ